ncbi:DNA-binding protein [Lysinibacillus sphaericus]|uniref:DNA-binding protein n=1 Tax=Lysinibacillus sphaericus TaxID=1421 RepID=UPI003F7AD8FC
MYSEEFKAQMKEELRELFREELNNAFTTKPLVRELPVLLTRDQLKELFDIKDTKASELLGRMDFPKFHEAGRVLIPSKALLQWIDEHTEWMGTNTRYFKSIV